MFYRNVLILFLFIAPGIKCQITGGSSELFPDTTISLPSEQYDAGPLIKILSGNNWISLWMSPFHPRILNSSVWNDEIYPVAKKDGKPAEYIFKSRDGNTFLFSPLNNNIKELLPVEIRGRLSSDIIRGMSGIINPAGPVIVFEILKSINIIYPEPYLCIIPAKILPGSIIQKGFIAGYIREWSRWDDKETGITTDSLFNIISADSKNIVDASSYLKMRLLDIYLNNPAANPQNIKWAIPSGSNVDVWSPLSREPELPFARYDGVILKLTFMALGINESFGETYGSIENLTHHSINTDRWLLASLNKPEWDSVTAYIKANLTDSVIINAVKKMPFEMYTKEGKNLIQDLIIRRDNLQEAADKYYAVLSKYVEINCGDSNEYVEVIRSGSGKTEINISMNRTERQQLKIFSRKFSAGETSEIRLLMRGGSDSIIVKGKSIGGSTLVISAGEAADYIVDSSEVSGYILNHPYNKSETEIYTENDSSNIIKNKSTIIYSAIEKQKIKNIDSLKAGGIYSGYGYEINWLPWLEINTDDGVLFGGGRNIIKHGYDRYPYVYKLELLGAYATKTRRVRAELTGSYSPYSEKIIYNFAFYATGNEVLNYYGQGNESRANGPGEKSEYYDVDQQQFIFQPYIDLPVSLTSRFSVGAVVKYVQTEWKDGTYLLNENPYGIDDMFFNNIFASYTIDTRNDDILPSSGSYISVKTAYFPRYLKNEYAFGKASVNGKYYYSMNLPFFASLAFRGGAEKIWGKYPFFESSFIGGQNSLRGVEKNRFAGDASVYAGIEFRSFFEKFDLLVPVEAGFNLFAETARVFISNKYSAGTWHKTFGGGIMLSLLKRDYTINFSAAVSVEGTEYYFTSGFPF